jgi:hypothetical protein
MAAISVLEILLHFLQYKVKIDHWALLLERNARLRSYLKTTSPPPPALKNPCYLVQASELGERLMVSLERAQSTRDQTQQRSQVY